MGCCIGDFSLKIHAEKIDVWREEGGDSMLL